MRTLAGLCLVAFAVWLAWTISNDYGRRTYEGKDWVYHSKDKSR